MTAPVEWPGYVEDSREQQALDLSPLPKVRRALPAGDYAPIGLETVAVVERKSMWDFAASCSWHRERFERELVKLADYKRAVIVVECQLHDILEWRYGTEVRPQALLGSIASFSARYGVQTLFAGDRAGAQFLVKALICKWAKHLSATSEAA